MTDTGFINVNPLPNGAVHGRGGRVEAVWPSPPCCAIRLNSVSYSEIGRSCPRKTSIRWVKLPANMRISPTYGSHYSSPLGRAWEYALKRNTEIEHQVRLHIAVRLNRRHWRVTLAMAPRLLSPRGMAALRLAEVVAAGIASVPSTAAALATRVWVGIRKSTAAPPPPRSQGYGQNPRDRCPTCILGSPKFTLSPPNVVPSSEKAPDFADAELTVAKGPTLGWNLAHQSDLAQKWFCHDMTPIQITQHISAQ